MKKERIRELYSDFESALKRYKKIKDLYYSLLAGLKNKSAGFLK